MPASTPSVESVLAAIKAQIETLPGIGVVKTSDQAIEDDMEYLVELGVDGLADFDVWVVELRGAPEREGDGVGEKYLTYSFWIRYWSLRTNDQDWSQKARIQAAAVQELLSGNANVFRVGGQVPLHTPEAVTIESHGKRTISGDEGPQMIYQTVLTLEVEARRWG